MPNDDPWCSPIVQNRTEAGLYLAVRHVELDVKPVRAPTGCSCSEANCEHSRIRDWYEFTLLPDLPSHYDWPCRHGDDEYCNGIDQCPPCPDDGWIVLARVWFNDSTVAEFDLDGFRRYVYSLAGMCPPCGFDAEYGQTGRDTVRPLIGQAARRYIATMSASPDSAVRLAFSDGTALFEATIAANRADIEGQTAAQLKEALGDVILFDSSTGTPVLIDSEPLTAAEILTNSPLRGDSVIDDVRDLEVRVGVPLVEAAAYRERFGQVQDLLDNDGLAEFEKSSLSDLRQLGSLDVMAINGVSTTLAKKLRAVNIDSLADLRAAENLPDLGAAQGRVAALQQLLITIEG